MRISILIPCHNEEKSIRQCVESCLTQTRLPNQIVVVDDGSTDRSLPILMEFGNQIEVVNLPQCTGNKSRAQQVGLKYITGDVFVTTDADTILDAHFLEHVEKGLANPKVAAVSGYVKSLRHNWLTAIREIDYIISQRLHKTAQSYMNSILVIPGCAAAFRTDVFRRYASFDHDTVTEDLDFTYKFNRANLKIKFDKEAISYTQDPADLKSYIGQMKRWFGGGWQNLKKHQRILTSPVSALELTLIYIEGLFFSLTFFVMPFINIKVFGYIMFFGLIMGLSGALYGAFAQKRFDLLLYAPLYPLVIPINCATFLGEFFRLFLFKKYNLVWFKPKRRAI